MYTNGKQFHSNILLRKPKHNKTKICLFVNKQTNNKHPKCFEHFHSLCVYVLGGKGMTQMCCLEGKIGLLTKRQKKKVSCEARQQEGL